MPKGFAPPGAGRPKGKRNRKTIGPIEQEKARHGGALPHEFLLEISQGRIVKLADGSEYAPTFKERLEAAIAAAPYYQPKLSSIEQKTEVTLQGVISAEPLSEDEWESQYGTDQKDNLGTAEGATGKPD